MVEKIVYDPTKDRQKAKPNQPEDKPKEKAKEKPKAKPTGKPEKKEPEAFINKYGFLHIDKNLAEHLGLKFGKDQANVPVNIERSEGGFTVKLKA